MASGGEITPGSRSWQAQYTVGDLRSVVAEAHRSGVPVAAHAHAVSAIERALDAGVDTIEHAIFRTADGVRPNSQLMDRLADHGSTRQRLLQRSPVPWPFRVLALDRSSGLYRQWTTGQAQITFRILLVRAQRFESWPRSSIRAGLSEAQPGLSGSVT
ncbi:hypothetical protein AB0C12_42935 [Actinoplanes sp. NPDC048967]|uniref:hypothetical protein n=1 Tax=Actinoplanes sp. NPDC048967 TaxID=3155269 RepID=UPI0033D9AABD